MYGDTVLCLRLSCKHGTNFRHGEEHDQGFGSESHAVIVFLCLLMSLHTFARRSFRPKPASRAQGRLPPPLLTTESRPQPWSSSLKWSTRNPWTSPTSGGCICFARWMGFLGYGSGGRFGTCRGSRLRNGSVAKSSNASVSGKAAGFTDTAVAVGSHGRCLKKWSGSC